MISLTAPWLELAIGLPLLSAALITRIRDPRLSRSVSLAACGGSLGCIVAACVEVWFDTSAGDAWSFLGKSPLVIDSLNVPLLPLAALLYLITVLATLGGKLKSISFSSLLVSESLLLATLGWRSPWGLVLLLILGIAPTLLEFWVVRQRLGLFGYHMAAFAAMLVGGLYLVEHSEPQSTASIIGVTMLAGALLVRSGIFPFHLWVPELFEYASLGSSLLFVTPMVGIYAFLRLAFPIAPDELLRGVSVLSVATAVYAAGMALVQSQARRAFCYLFLSHSCLVLAGLSATRALSLTGTLCAWISISLGMAGFGLTLRTIEARTGRLSMRSFAGLFFHTPRLAALFLVTGLASIGFPGTIGFVGAELLVEGSIQNSPTLGILIVMISALNGLAVLKIYFHVFTGPRRPSSIDLRSRPAERIAVLALTTIIVLGGMFPQSYVGSRYAAASHLIEQRSQIRNAASHLTSGFSGREEADSFFITGPQSADATATAQTASSPPVHQNGYYKSRPYPAESSAQSVD